MTVTLHHRDGSSVTIASVRLVELAGPQHVRTATFGNGPVEHHDVASLEVEPFVFTGDGPTRDQLMPPLDWGIDDPLVIAGQRAAALEPSRPKHDCDENCRCCGECYQATGQSICLTLCRHGVALAAALTILDHAPLDRPLSEEERAALTIAEAAPDDLAAAVSAALVVDCHDIVDEHHAANRRQAEQDATRRAEQRARFKRTDDGPWAGGFAENH